MARIPFYEYSPIISFPNGDQFEFVQGSTKEGASSLVYRVYRLGKDNKRTTEHLLKEYYPKNVSSLYRDSSGCLKVRDSNDEELFMDGLRRFQQGYTQQIEIRNDLSLKNETCDIQEIYHDIYGTEFIRMPTYRGSTYGDFEDKSLLDLLQRIRAITRVVSRYHEKGYLLLDIKPDNIFIDPENSTFVQLFDFDSILSIESRKDASSLSTTKYWSAPEFKYANANEVVSFATDIFSIGEILFFKLLGRHSSAPDRDPGATYFEDNKSYDGLLGEATPAIRRKLRAFFQSTILNFHESRWQETAPVLHALDEIIAELQKPDTPIASVPERPLDSANISKGLSKLSRAIIIAALMICIAIGFFVFWQSSNSASSDPNIPSQNIEPSTNEMLTNPSIEEHNTSNVGVSTPADGPLADEQNNAQTPIVSAKGEEQTTVVDTYSISTVASGLSNLASMTMDNAGTVYYIDGNILYCSGSAESVDLTSAFGQPLNNCYLAYDSNSGVVYLVSDTKRIFDVTSFEEIKEVLNADNCPALSGFSLEYHPSTSCTRQIMVLSDGSLLLPGDLARPFRVNPTNKTVTEYGNHVYENESGYYSKLIGNSIVRIREGDTEATVSTLSGDKHTINFHLNAPDNEGAAFATENGIISYIAGTGVCRYNIDGSCDILIDQKDIVVQDYESLANVNIWSLAANEAGAVAFYDNTLKSIRLITPPVPLR